MSIILPLEEILQDLATSRPNDFPMRNVNYWDRYSSLLNHLRSQIYPHINAGLACLSKSPGIYTDHGGDHFDEVVRYAGCLVPLSLFKEKEGPINPYELYLLLAAIRLHDAGNIDGRENHERRAYQLLMEAGAAICPDTSEARLIADIAQAHGGRTDSDDKDTIGNLPAISGYASTRCKPREVAALVRFSDEICEHRSRASFHHIHAGTLPPENALFHLYANGVKRAEVASDSKTFHLGLEFDKENLIHQYKSHKIGPKKPKDKYLLDDALDRVEKLNAERLYCNQYLSPIFRIDRVHIQITLTNSDPTEKYPFPKIWRSHEFTIGERGYPSQDNSWRVRDAANITGKTIAAEFTKEEPIR